MIKMDTPGATGSGYHQDMEVKEKTEGPIRQKTSRIQDPSLNYTVRNVFFCSAWLNDGKNLGTICLSTIHIVAQ